MDHRMKRVMWGGPGKGAGTRALTSEANRRKPLAWNRKALAEGSRPFVFCSSLSDVFDNQVPQEWRAELFDLIRATPALVWMLLTKRPQNIVGMVTDSGPVPPNIALGTTIEDQIRAQNAETVLKAASVLLPLFTFVSCEPLIAEVNLRRIRIGITFGAEVYFDALTGCYSAETSHGIDALPQLPARLPGLDFVITGGETDQGKHRARPTHPGWFRLLRDQCRSLWTPFHHKQNGEWVSVGEVEGPGEHYHFPDGATVRRVGRARSGRAIDGIIHDARPAV